MTNAEEAMWSLLRRKGSGVRFRRMHPILGWIVDFYCPRHQLVVEVDGPVHAERLDEDNHRDEVMRAHGLTVLRFSNDAIQDPIAVLLRIDQAIHPKESPTSPSPLG